MKYKKIVTASLSFALSAAMLSALSVDTKLNTNVNVGSGTSATSTSSVMIETNIPVINIGSRTDIDSTEANASDVMMAEQVNSGAQLNTYAQNIMKTDESVESVLASDDTIEVKYKTYTKLFGIFPITGTATTEVSNTGEIKTHYPWYAIFSSKDEGKVKAEIETHIQNVIATNTGGATLDAKAKARVLNAVYLAMKNDYQTSLNADIETK